MNALEGLVGLYSKSDNTLSFVEKLKMKRNSHVRLKGLAGSSAAFVVASAAAHLGNLNVCILPEQESAAYFLNDLENILGKSRVLFFPAAGRRGHNHAGPDYSNLLLRTEVLTGLISDRGLISSPGLPPVSSQEKKEARYIVTYPEALEDKVATKSYLLKNTLQVQKGEKLSIDFVVDVLLEYGFDRCDYVSGPGQFSVRGGIIDVFSFSNDDPYRIELSGDEVESIRSFDATSQLSIDQLEEITVVPDLQTEVAGESRQNFLEYIPADTIIWLNNIEKGNEKNEPGESFDNYIRNFSCVEFGQSYYFEPDLELVYDFVPQPVFNKNFDLLLANLRENVAGGFRNIIFSDTQKQVERLRNIFNDLEPPVRREDLGNREGDRNDSETEVNTDQAADPELFVPIHLSIHEGFRDKQNKVACYTDHQIFERYHRFRLKNTFSKTSEAITLKEIKGLNPGDYITHIDHGVGRYGGLEKMEVNGKLQEAIRLVYRDNDILYVSIQSLHRISKFSSKEGAVPKTDKLGSAAWQNLKQKTKRKVMEIAFDLIKLYAERKAKKGFAFAPDTYLQNELEASFIYEDTPDQLKATIDVKKDMEDQAPMDRLICGDVGFGKTEIAVRAAFKAVVDGKQAAVLVPTTILALQHFKTFSERLKGIPCTVDYINRFKSAKEQKETLQKLAEGKIDIIIGTHRIVGKDVKFKDLGLLVIDEEQKFGVGVKDKLKTIKVNVDTLTLTATPIPRTLQFSMMGARDLSIINTPPPNRYPIQTELHSFNHELIRETILYEVSRGGQVFFIHNRVGTLVEMELLINKLCPKVKTLTVHGQMDGEKLEEAMMNFINGDYDILISTTIVESGLDIPNANTMIINDAHTFGLSDLHQLRGRVGRSNKKAFCYLLAPPLSVLTTEAQKRLRAISEFSDLGSGFQISMRDLDIRGAGNLLGAEQSGFITEIGYEMYQKILDEALEELREDMKMRGQTATGRPEPAGAEVVTGDRLSVSSHQSAIGTEEGQGISGERGEGVMGDRLAVSVERAKRSETVFLKDCQIDTDFELLIPDSYVSNSTERLSLYRELDDSKTEADLVLFEQRLKDRFGPLPEPTIELIHTVRLRWLSVQLGFEKVVLKKSKLLGYFISKPNSAYFQSPVFSKVLNYVQQHGRLCKMKEVNHKLSLTFEHIHSIDQAIDSLRKVAV